MGKMDLKPIGVFMVFPIYPISLFPYRKIAETGCSGSTQEKLKEEENART